MQWPWEFKIRRSIVQLLIKFIVAGVGLQRGISVRHHNTTFELSFFTVHRATALKQTPVESYDIITRPVLTVCLGKLNFVMSSAATCNRYTFVRRTKPDTVWNLSRDLEIASCKTGSKSYFSQANKETYWAFKFTRKLFRA